MTQAERRQEVRTLWMKMYPEAKRNGNYVLAFHGWLEQNRPDLLPTPKHGDPYQHLKSDLYGLWSDQ